VTTTRNVFKVFLSHTRQYKWSVILTIFLITLGQVVGVLSPWYYKLFFDALAKNGLAPETIYPILLHTLVTVLIIQIFFLVTSRAGGFLATHTATHIMADLEKSAFKYLLGHSHNFFANNFTGSLVRRVRRLSKSFADISENFLWIFLQNLIMISGAAIILWQRNYILSLILVGWVFLFLSASYLFTLWKLKFDEARANEDSHSTAVTADAITNSATIQLFTGRQFEEGLFDEAITRWRLAARKAWFLSDGNEAAQWLLMSLLEFGIMYAAVQLWLKGLLTVGDFVLIQSYLIAVFIRVWDLGRVIRKTYEAVADAKEMVEIMEMPYEIKDARQAKVLRVTKGKIVFKQITFLYRKKRKILNGFSLSIVPHEKIALVGPSGAGKSTVTKLLMRFHDLQKGMITIDGQDIAKVTQESLRSQIAFVPQEPILFHRSLIDNIRYGQREATDKEVIEAAKQAHCHEFIASLPEGYQTFVGERGIKLSGGERQRVAIARAILKNAPILILDEATSSLDSESESYIQEALAILMKDKTTIVIAHRLSTILKMDRIVVMEEGKVVDAGTHQELVKRKGTYKKLWEIQAGGFVEKKERIY